MKYTDIKAQSEEEFIVGAVKAITHIVNEAIKKDGQAIIGLSGGTTPGPIYSELGKQNIDWSAVSIFLVDERYVDATSPDSNQKLIRDTLLQHAKIPELQCVFPHTNLPIDACMKDYTKKLKEQWNEKLPDVLILGMGPDGHIASLFPPLATSMMDDTSLVLHTQTNTFAVHDRITLSLNPLAAAEHHVFLLKGPQKIAVWKDMMESDDDERRWPAKRLLEAGKTIVVTCNE